MLVDFHGPNWFFGIDIIIQLIGMVIALLISYYGLKCYKISSKKTDLYFSLAFFLLGLTLLIYIFVVPAVFIYYTYYSSIDPGILLKGSHILNFIFIFSTLGAFALLNLVYSKIKTPNAIITVFILILSLAYFIYYSRSFIGLNIVSFLLVLQISLNIYKNWSKKKTTNSLLVLVAFAFIGLSTLFFILGNYLNISFLFGHISQLLGFGSLLTMLLRIHYGHRKKK